MQVNRNIEARSCNHCSSRKWISIIYSECVFVGLGIQHAMRMRHIVICDLPGSTIFLHITLTTARFEGGRGKLLKMQCLFWVSLQFLSETFLILRKTKLYIIAMYIGLPVKYPLLLPDFNETRIFSKENKKILKYQIS
jgi:hypothetical protein